MANKITTYSEWIAAVKAEYNKLDACLGWLSKDGEDRQLTYYHLWDLSTFCADAQELLEWIESREGLDRYQNQALNSHYAEVPIRKLRRLAQKEG